MSGSLFDLVTPALAPESRVWLAACPWATVVFAANEEAGTIEVVAANAAAMELLLPGARSRDANAVLATLDDPRETLLRDRVIRCRQTGEPGQLNLLARPADAAEATLLEARVAQVGEQVAVFLKNAPGPGRLATGEREVSSESAAFAISRAAQEAESMEALCDRIHAIVGELIGVKNLYIALVDQTEQMLRFVYSKDEFEKRRVDRRLGLGVTDLVYFSGQPLLLDRSAANCLLAEGKVVNFGIPAQVWLGIPLKVAGRTFGVMAVQDYFNPHLIGEPERRLLAFVSDQIASAIAVQRAAAEARQAREEAERAARVKSDFIAVMSHELRTPLSVIIGYSELMQFTLAGRAEEKQAASIREAGHRLLAAIDQVLDFSKLDAHAHPVCEQLVLLDDLQRSLEAFFASRVKEQEQTFTWECEGFVPDAIKTDGQILRQIVIQLVGNAVRFTPRGGRIAVKVRAEPIAPFHTHQHRVLIAVEDSGVGISDEKLGKLFQPFEESHRPSPSEGAGLGLAVGQRLAQLLDGRITVRSVVGKGSVFTLAFSAVAATKEGEPLAVPDATERLELLLRARVAGLGWRTLVVDQDDSSRAMLTQMIVSITGADVVPLGSSTEALEFCRKEKVSLVVLHAGLPSPDGVETCRMIRSAPHTYGRPYLLMLSADHSPQVVQRSLAAGADDYLPKPVSRLALAQGIMIAVDAARGEVSPADAATARG